MYNVVEVRENIMKNKLLLIRGLPGSGKTTLSYSPEYKDYVKIEADQFWKVDGVYTFKFKFLGYAHEWCRGRTAYHMNRGNDVIVSNTFISSYTMFHYYELSVNFGYTFKIINCYNDYGSIHDVPEDVLESMTKRWEHYTTKSFIERYNDISN